MHLRLALISLLAAPGCESETSCRGHQPVPCFEVEGGRYLVLEPPGPVAGPAPILVWFHGYGRSAEKTLDRPWMRQGLERHGVTGILLDGLNHTWNHVGSPSQGSRDDLAYLDAVMADVRDRFDVDPNRTWLSGHSQGGSMAWDAACYRGADFSAAFPASGTFWEPLPATCTDGPVELRHSHGLQDTTMPLEGRAIGSWQQGNVFEGIEVWKAVDDCPEDPDQIVQDGPYACQVWDRCTSGKQLSLCLYDGPHLVPDGWLGANLRWAEERALLREAGR